MSDIFIKGTAMVTEEHYENDPNFMGSFLICIMETWMMNNFSRTGEFIFDYPEEVRKKYGEVRQANEGFQNDLHNLAIGYHQMKSIVGDKNIDNGLKGLYLGNLVEHYITNMRCIYDYMAVFARIVVEHKYLPIRTVSAKSLNDLLRFAKNQREKAEQIFSVPVVKIIKNMEKPLVNIKTIRDGIIHDGKETMISFRSGSPQIRLIKSIYKRDETLLPNLLELNSLDYPMFPYLQHVTRTLFSDMELLGRVMANHFGAKNENFYIQLSALIGICIKDFMEFLIDDF